jgi:hypothetical protein
VVEGDHPVGPSGGDELADGRWRRGERGGCGVDEGAEEAGGGGFAGVRGTLQDEDGIGSLGPEGGEEPGEAAEPVGAGREIEAGAQGFERVARGVKRDGHGRR